VQTSLAFWIQSSNGAILRLVMHSGIERLLGVRLAMKPQFSKQDLS